MASALPWWLSFVGDVSERTLYCLLAEVTTFGQAKTNRRSSFSTFHLTGALVLSSTCTVDHWSVGRWVGCVSPLPWSSTFT